MRHLILSLLVLGFSQNLQAKLDVNAFSSENNENNTEYLECVRKSKVESVKNFSAEAPSSRSTASVNNQQKKDKRTPAQERASDEQILSLAHSCVAHFPFSGTGSVFCIGVDLSSIISGSEGNGERIASEISRISNRLGSAGFISTSCWHEESSRFCIYHKLPQ